MSKETADGSHVFITRALKDLAKLSSGGPLGLLSAPTKRVQKLKEMCTSVLEKLALPTAGLAPFPMEDAAQAVYLGCQCNHAEIAKVSLDTIQKLISYGHMHSIASKDVIIKDGVVGCLIPNGEVQLQVVKALVAAVTHDVVHNEALGSAVSCVFELCVSGKTHDVRTTARTIVTQMVNTIYNRVETEYIALKAMQASERNAYTESKIIELESTLQTHLVDAASNFMFFCQQADPDVIEPLMTFDSREVLLVQISLDFVLKILRSSGPAFREAEALLDTVQESLLSCVVKGALCPRIEICKPCLDIVVVLISDFKQHLRVEIGTLFTTIIFRILENINISVTHKISVLSAIDPLVTTAHILVDVFVNYDCDLEAINLFEHLLGTLSTVAQTSLVGEPNQITQKDDYHIRYLAVASIVSVLRSLVHWLAHHGRVVTTGAAPTTAMLEKQRHWKRDVARAVDMFNKKPKKGVQFLMEADLVEKNSAAGVARFFRSTKNLDLDLVGEYLSDTDKFNTEVMSEYCATIDFQDVTLDNALRNFLNLFKLPKEGQKIERVLEFFSTRWYMLNKANPLYSLDLENPDAPYVITVAIVMLNTDLHNPQVKNKMTCDQFCSQLRGVNGGKDMPRPLMEEMYQRIEGNPMIMDNLKPADPAAHKTPHPTPAEKPKNVVLAAVSGVRSVANGDVFVTKQEKKTQKHNTEMEKIFTTTREELKDATKVRSPYFMAADVEHVKPMFGTTWASILAAISSQLECATTKEMATLCLEAYDLGIHIAVVFEMDPEREAFIKSLSKLTYLDGSKQILTKNILCIKQLLKTSVQDGDNLRGGWVSVFTILSHIDRLQTLNPKLATADEIQNADKISKVQHDLDIHKIFAHAVALSETGIRDFIVALCEVALLEVGLGKPRMYCLQKVVEVSAENVGQRLVPAWGQMSSLMVNVGCHADETVAQYGVDSLRQLISKLFDQPQMIACELQPEFLMPYKLILGNGKASVTVHDFVLHCLHNIVVVKGSVLAKGWGVVLRTLAGVPGNVDAGIVKRSFELLQYIMDNCMAFLAPYLVETLQAITLFASGTTVTAVALEALNFMDVVLTRAGELDGEDTADSFEFPPLLSPPDAQTFYGRTWNACVANYTLLLVDARPDIRSRSCEMLSNMLQRSAGHIPPVLWKCAFTYLGAFICTTVSGPNDIPPSPYEVSLRAHMQRDVNASHSHVLQKCKVKEWVASTGVTVFALLRQSTVEHFQVPEVSAQMECLLETISTCVARDDETVLQLSAESLMGCIRTAGDKLQPLHWRIVMDNLFRVLRRCRVRPTLLVPFASPDASLTEVVDDPIYHTNLNVSEALEPLTADNGAVYFMDEPRLIGALATTALRQQLILPVVEHILGTHLSQLTEDEVDMCLHSLLGCAQASSFFHIPALHAFRVGITNDVVLKRMISRLRHSYVSYFKVCVALCEASPAWRARIEDSWLAVAMDLALRYMKRTSLPSDDGGVLVRVPSMKSTTNITTSPSSGLPPEYSETIALSHVLVQVIGEVFRLDDGMFMEYFEAGGLYELCVDMVLAPSLDVRREVQRSLKRHYVLLKKKGVVVPAKNYKSPPLTFTRNAPLRKTSLKSEVDTTELEKTAQGEVEK